MRRLIYILFFLSISPAGFAQTASTDTGQVPTFRMTGDVSLLSNFVRRGLTQTEKDPALQGSFWFNFGSQFRLGVWASNVRYRDEAAHLNLQLTGDIKVVFSPNSNLILRFANEQYFTAAARKGTITSLVLTTFDLVTTYDSISNWEGTLEKANYYNFLYKFNLNPNWTSDVQLGYTQPVSATHNSFFDTAAHAHYKGGQIRWSMGLGYTSEDTFSRGGLQIILGAKTEF